MWISYVITSLASSIPFHSILFYSIPLIWFHYIKINVAGAPVPLFHDPLMGCPHTLTQRESSKFLDFFARFLPTGQPLTHHSCHPRAIILLDFFSGFHVELLALFPQTGPLLAVPDAQASSLAVLVCLILFFILLVLWAQLRFCLLPEGFLTTIPFFGFLPNTPGT